MRAAYGSRFDFRVRATRSFRAICWRERCGQAPKVRQSFPSYLREQGSFWQWSKGEFHARYFGPARFSFPPSQHSATREKANFRMTVQYEPSVSHAVEAIFAMLRSWRCKKAKALLLAFDVASGKGMFIFGGGLSVAAVTTSGAYWQKWGAAASAQTKVRAGWCACCSSGGSRVWARVMTSCRFSGY